MEIKPGSPWVLLLALLPAALGLLVLLADGRAVQTLRNKQFDQFQRWHPRAYEEVPVRIVDVDEASLERLGQWPWPHTRLAALLDRLGGAGAAAVAFDVVFAEPDRTAPQAMANVWGLSGSLRAQVLTLPTTPEGELWVH
jgi:adenylate cyclase